jgi:hypothetical protein
MMAFAAFGLFLAMVVAWVLLPGGAKTGIADQDIANGVSLASGQKHLF